MAKFTTHEAGYDCIWVRRSINGICHGLCRTTVTSLMKILKADMGIATMPVGAYLDPSTAVPSYLELSRTHGCMHDAIICPQLSVFFDANEMYGLPSIDLV